MMRRLLMVVLALLTLSGVAIALYRAEILWFSHPSSDHPVRILDVSHHQGEIDWGAVYASGERYAWIKATEGGDWVDRRFDENRQAAEAAGIGWGGYHFLTFCRPAADQAENFIKTLGSNLGSLPPAVDIESGGNCKNGTPPADLSSMVADFIRRVEARIGRRMVIYLIEDQLPKLFSTLSLPDRPLWVRNLYSQPSLPAGQKATFWQYHARAWVDGITTPADHNVFLGSKADFDVFLDKSIITTESAEEGEGG